MESDVTQSAFFYKTWAWAETHRKHLLWGAAGVLIAGLVAGYYIYQAHENEVAASHDLVQVATQASASGRVPAPEALVKVASEHPDTEAGERALLLAGARFFAEGKYADAQAQFQKFMAENPESEFTGHAAFGVASALEAEGKVADAITAYKNIAERRSSDTVAPQARLALARLYVAQTNLTQARDLYQEVARPENGGYAREAMFLLQELMQKHPELNPPPVASTNAAPQLKAE